jgi:ATP-dependent DNA helicase RecG
MMGLALKVDVLCEKNNTYLQVQVPKSNIPISLKGKYYYRSGTITQELNGIALQNFLLNKSNITWDAVTISDAKFSDLDIDLINWFIRKSVDVKRLNYESLNEDVKTVLKKLDLINEANELTRAAILLFARRPAKYIKTATTKIGRFGESDSDLINQDVIECNLLEMSINIMQVLQNKYLNNNISFDGLLRVEKLEIPENALREVIFNALVHKDYSEHTDFTIKVFSNRIVFWNNGELIAP